MSASAACACRKSNPNILVVQATQNRTAKDVSSALNGARYRREGDRIIAESGAVIDYIVRRHGDGLRNLL